MTGTAFVSKQPAMASVFDVAKNLTKLTGSDAAALRRIFHVTANPAACVVSPELSVKYNVPQDNKQFVVSFTNRWSTQYLAS